MRRLTLEEARARVAVVLRVGLTTREVLLHEHVDRDAVFGVHHDRRAVVARLLHCAQDLAVVGVEHARIGHEQLERRDTLVLHEVVHVGECLVVDATDDLVERVVDRAIAGGLCVPLGERLLHVLAIALHGEVDDRGHTTPRRGGRSSFERVARKRATEWQLHVRVHVDATGHHVLTLGVDHLVGGDVQRLGLAALEERRNRVALDEDVDFVSPGRADDRAVLDQCACHVSPFVMLA